MTHKIFNKIIVRTYSFDYYPSNTIFIRIATQTLEEILIYKLNSLGTSRTTVLHYSLKAPTATTKSPVFVSRAISSHRSNSP